MLVDIGKKLFPIIPTYNRNSSIQKKKKKNSPSTTGIHSSKKYIQKGYSPFTASPANV
jgi:hypothetical protein